jgi:hypothetical protein
MAREFIKNVIAAALLLLVVGALAGWATAVVAALGY